MLGSIQTLTILKVPKFGTAYTSPSVAGCPDFWLSYVGRYACPCTTIAWNFTRWTLTGCAVCSDFFFFFFLFWMHSSRAGCSFNYFLPFMWLVFVKDSVKHSQWEISHERKARVSSTKGARGFAYQKLEHHLLENNLHSLWQNFMGSDLEYKMCIMLGTPLDEDYGHFFDTFCKVILNVLGMLDHPSWTLSHSFVRFMFILCVCV